MTTRAALHRDVVLLAITDFDRVDEATLFARAERLARSARPGRVALELRDRTRPTRLLWRLAQRLSDICRRYDQRLVINDRLDLALAISSDGIHLGEASVPTEDARRLVPQAHVYRACHAVEGIEHTGADSVLLSPVLEPRKGNPALGVAALERARARLAACNADTKLFALGGIDVARAASCLAAGADGIAAIGAVFDREDPEPLLRALGISRAQRSSP